MKKLIKQRLFGIDSDIFEGNIKDVANKILNIPTIWTKSPDFQDFEIELEYYGYDGGREYYLVGLREETDDEYKDRLALESSLKAKAERIREKKTKSERELYEMLKKKFENV